VKWIVRLTLMAVISIGVAFVLSVFPHLENRQAGGPWTAQPERTVLANDNLVDQIIRLPLRLDIKRVDWDNGILALDLALAAKNVAPSVVYHDLVTISYFGFAQTVNVNHILVRVLGFESGHAPHLLLALRADRTHWAKDDFRLLTENRITSEQFLRENFQLIATPRWKPGN
jgi:hypothetical protein